MKNKRKEVLIPFTGGLDSTYLLIKNIEKKNTIQTFYVQVENNHHKTEIELAHRRYILEYLSDKFGGASLGLGRDNTSAKISISGRLAMSQPPIWLLFINFVSCGQKTVEISYVLNDCAVSFIDDIKKMYKTYRPFFDCLKTQPKLKFPLIKTQKSSIYYNIPHDLRKYTWSCECPDIQKTQNTKDHLVYSNCGDCDSCKKEKMFDIFSNRTLELDKVTKKITIIKDPRSELSGTSKSLNKFAKGDFESIKFTPRRQLGDIASKALSIEKEDEEDNALYSAEDIAPNSTAELKAFVGGDVEI